MAVDEPLTNCIETLWRLTPPGPDQLMQHPAFIKLAELSRPRYGGGEKLAFSLHQVLLAIGLPCRLSKRPDLILLPAQAAEALDIALSRKARTVRYLAPLDLGGDLPALSFGPCRVATFTAAELAVLFDAPRLARLYPDYPFDAKRLSEFYWLVIEEEAELDPSPEKRAVPFWFESLARDFGAVDPHPTQFPELVERALFFLMTGPWEDWSTHEGLEWRGFRVPWVYTLDADLCVRPMRPPDPGTLSWEPWIFEDRYGDEVELERPVEYHLDDEAQDASTLFDDATWQRLEVALAAPLFETPVMHFLVRGFLSDGIDEFMSHITTIEAALGLEADHFAKLRQQPDPRPNLRSTNRIGARIAALLGDVPAAKDFGALFNLRSGFIHGRKSVGMISSAQRVTARRLARRVVAALVGRAILDTRTREDVLYDLLIAGAPII